MNKNMLNQILKDRKRKTRSLALILCLSMIVSLGTFAGFHKTAQAKVFKETGVILTGVGVYSYNTGSDEIAAIRNAVQEKVMAHDWALQIHGFHLNPETKELRFDVVTSFDVDPKEAIATLQEEIQAIVPDYTVCITRDVDIAD